MIENHRIVNEYVSNVLSSKKIACKEIKQACQRYLDDLKNDDYEFRLYDPEFIIRYIERNFVHEQGQRLNGSPLLNQPFILEPWQKFIIYNLVGFYYKGTEVRRFTEALIMVPRKNGKTPFITAFAYAYGLLERRSGSKCFICGSNLREAKQSYNFLKHNVLEWQKDMTGEQVKTWRVLDNNQQHSIGHNFSDGAIYFEALVARDSIVGNLCILDELHEYKTSKQYDQMKKSQKAYTNKLTLGITTAGDDMNSFCYDHMKYCMNVINPKETTKDKGMFVFITKADEDENGDVGYLDSKNHEMANPNYNVTIRPSDIESSARQAQEKPMSRKEFLAKDLNIYTSSFKSYFDTKNFAISDELYDFGYRNPIIVNYNELVNYEELANLGIEWYGGADLSMMHDLTAAALFGVYDGIGIIVTHAFYPQSRAVNMSDKLRIPVYGWQEEGWLTFSNGDVVEYNDVVNWFIEMREYGFNIREVGFDKQMAREFVMMMKENDFVMENVQQSFWIKSEGFKRIEYLMYKKQLYFLHSNAYLYCVENIKVTFMSGDRIHYGKTNENLKIDLFDASVFAVVRYMENLENEEDMEWEW